MHKVSPIDHSAFNKLSSATPPAATNVDSLESCCGKVCDFVALCWKWIMELIAACVRYCRSDAVQEAAGPVDILAPIRGDIATWKQAKIVGARAVGRVNWYDTPGPLARITLGLAETIGENWGELIDYYFDHVATQINQKITGRLELALAIFTQDPADSLRYKCRMIHRELSSRGFGLPSSGEERTSFTKGEPIDFPDTALAGSVDWPDVAPSRPSKEPETPSPAAILAPPPPFNPLVEWFATDIAHWKGIQAQDGSRVIGRATLYYKGDETHPHCRLKVHTFYDKRWPLYVDRFFEQFTMPFHRNPKYPGTVKIALTFLRGDGARTINGRLIHRTIALPSNTTTDSGDVALALSGPDDLSPYKGTALSDSVVWGEIIGYTSDKGISEIGRPESENIRIPFDK